LEETASAAIKDAYRGLKSVLVRKFGGKSSIESLEGKPGSPSKQASVKEDLGAGAAADPEVMACAKAVVDAVGRDDPAAGKALGLHLAGIKAAFLTVGNITSEGTAAKLRDSTFPGGITLGDLTAGRTKPPLDA
jgi:hypothetical protein